MIFFLFCLLGSWESCSEQNESDEDSDGSWINVCHSSDENELEVPDEVKNMTSDEKAHKAKEIFESRILTQEDFKKVKKRQIQKETENFKKGSRKRSQSVVLESDEEERRYDVISLIVQRSLILPYNQFLMILRQFAHCFLFLQLRISATLKNCKTTQKNEER